MAEYRERPSFTSYDITSIQTRYLALNGTRADG